MATVTIYEPSGSVRVFENAIRVEVREGMLTFYMPQNGDMHLATKYMTNFPFLVEEATGYSGI